MASCMLTHAISLKAFQGFGNYDFLRHAKKIDSFRIKQTKAKIFNTLIKRDLLMVSALCAF